MTRTSIRARREQVFQFHTKLCNWPPEWHVVIIYPSSLFKKVKKKLSSDNSDLLRWVPDSSHPFLLMPVEDWKIWRSFACKETTFLHSPHQFLWVKFRADESRRSGSGAWFNLRFIEHAYVETDKIFAFLQWITAKQKRNAQFNEQTVITAVLLWLATLYDPILLRFSSLCIQNLWKRKAGWSFSQLEYFLSHFHYKLGEWTNSDKHVYRFVDSQYKSVILRKKNMFFSFKWK